MSTSKGRTGNGSALRASGSAACIALALVTAVPACARPGNTPSAGTPEASSKSVRVGAAARPDEPGTQAVPSRLPPGLKMPRSCATPPPGPPARAPGNAPRGTSPPGTSLPGTSLPGTSPRGTGDADAAERARRVLEANNKPVPTRGAVKPSVIPAAENCVHLLSMRFSLLAAGGKALTEPTVRAELLDAGLTGVIVDPGPTFAASTGQACVVGTLAAGTPTFAITPLAGDGSCRS